MKSIKKFLKDNKGATYSPLAVKQLLIKFIELMSEKAVVKSESSNIQALSPELLDELQVGDVVQKITGKQKHCYVVTYKGEGAGEGICLTYCAAGYMETVSYDRSGSSWVYNSTDVVSFSPEEVEGVKELLRGKIKSGMYFLDEYGNDFVRKEEVPEGYTGSSITIGDDGIHYIKNFNNGQIVDTLELSPYGVDKVTPQALVGLTHSFNELNPTLKAIVNDAISNGSATCSLQQWTAIKNLLDISLYFNYSGYSLLKTATDGLHDYVFGTGFPNNSLDCAFGFEIQYNEVHEELSFADATY